MDNESMLKTGSTEDMGDMTESKANRLFVYVLTEGYVKPNELQAGTIFAMTLGQGDPDATGVPLEDQAKIRAELPEGITGALLFSGPSLRNPGALADMLEKDPYSRLIVIIDDKIISFTHDRQSEDYKALIPNLKRASEDGLDSWSWLNNLISELKAGKR